MRLLRFFVLPLFVFQFGCSTPSRQVSFDSEPKSREAFNEATLTELGISTATKSKAYPFEEFYKTAPIHGFQINAKKTGVYFLKKDARVENIFEYDFKSKKLRQVTHYPETVKAYVVDPLGKFLVIQKDQGGSEIYDLYKFDLATKKTYPLTEGMNKERSFLCDIKRDGSEVYFSQSRDTRSVYDIKAVTFPDLKTRILMPANHEQLYCDSLNEAGTQLSFRRFVDNNEIHVGLLDIQTGKFNYILEDKGVKNESTNFANGDGDLLFLSTKDSDVSRLWKYNIANGKLIREDIGVATGIEEMAILAKSKVSVIKYRGELTPKVQFFDGVFSSKKSLPFESEEIKGGYFDKDRADLGILIIQKGAAPQQYYLYEGGRTALFYDSNQSKVKTQEFSKSHSLFVKSFDGLKVPVHYFLPNGTSSKNKRPVAFWIHGGPEDHVDPEFSSNMQFLINQGFIVVAPNVRGSSGFGKKYQFMDNGDWGGAHIKDIVAVAEFTKGLEFVDANNIFLLGGSFGGFSVLSLITQYPKVFKAAVDIFGLIEMSSFMEAWPPNAQAYWISELGFDPRIDKVPDFLKESHPISTKESQGETV